MYDVIEGLVLVVMARRRKLFSATEVIPGIIGS